MSDIAKIGVVVDASGVDEARAKLAELGKTGNMAGGQLFYMGDALADSSQGVGNLHRNIVPLHNRLGPLRAGLAGVVEQFGLVGPAASIAADATLHLSTGFKAATAASLAAAAGIGAAFHALEIARDTLKSIDESFDSKNIAKTNEELGQLKERLNEIPVNKSLGDKIKSVFEQVGAAVGLLDKNKIFSETALIDVIKSKEAGLFAARRDLTSEQNRLIQNQIDLIGKDLPGAIEEQGRQAKESLIAQNRLWKLSSDQLHGLTGQIDNLTKAKLGELATQTKIQILGLENQKKALGATATQLIEFNTEEKLATLNLQKANAEVINQTKQLGALQKAFKNIEIGKGVLSDFRSTFSIDFDFDKDLAAGKLAKLFESVFNSPVTKAAARAGFSTLISSLSDMGTQNISGLLRSLGISSNDLADLKQNLQPVVTGFEEIEQSVMTWKGNAFGGGKYITETFKTLVPITRDLRAELENSDQSMKDWGTDSQEAGKKSAQAESTAGAAMEEFNKSAQAAVNKVAELAAAIDGIPANTVKTITVRVVTEGDTTFFSNSAFDNSGASSGFELNSLTREDMQSEILPMIEQAIRRTTGTTLGTRTFN